MYPFINTRRISPLQATKETKILPQTISTIEIEGELREAIYSIEDANQLPKNAIIAIANNPNPIIEKKELKIQISFDGDAKTVAAIEDCAIEKPHIAAMGRMSPDKESLLEKEIADLLERGLIEFSDGTWRANGPH